MSEILKGIDLSVLEDNNALNEGEAVDNILKTLEKKLRLEMMVMMP